MTDSDYTLGLSLLDFLPNLAFFVNAYFLARLVWLNKRPFPLALMILGAIFVFLGGSSKAIWKLLFTLGKGDFLLLSEIQFFLLGPGFLLMLLSAVYLISRKKEERGSGLMSIALWKIPLLALVTLSSLGLQFILIYLSFQRKAIWAAVLIIIAIICMLGMAVMAGGEQTVQKQWIEEIINSFGQIAWAIGSYLLYNSTRNRGSMQS
jgi:hypothetical protein